MGTNHKRQVVLVWLALVLLTFVAWGFGLEHGGSRSTAPDVAMAVVLAIAFVKTQLVGSVFMELRTAPVPLRLAFGGSVLGIGAVLIAMYLVL